MSGKTFSVSIDFRDQALRFVGIFLNNLRKILTSPGLKDLTLHGRVFLYQYDLSLWQETTTVIQSSKSTIKEDLS